MRRQVLAVPPLRPLCLAVKAFLRCEWGQLGGKLGKAGGQALGITGKVHRDVLASTVSAG